MSDKRGWGRTVLGWFIVPEGGAGGAGADTGGDADAGAPGGAAGSSDADALIARYAAGSGAATASAFPVKLEGGAPPVVDGKLDFVDVYERAGVDASERDRVSRAQELLKSLPAETPSAVKRQIVEAALRSFGVPTEKIIEAAVEHVQALEACIVGGQERVQAELAEAERRIAGLQAEIAQIQQVMEQARAEQYSRERACNGEKLRVQPVLEFFGPEAVAQVVAASPKLHEPA